MTLRTRTPKRWACRRCGHLNEPQHVNCRGQVECLNGEYVACGGKRRKKPVRGHRRNMVGDTYPLFVQAAEQIHGVTDESCCACGKPRSQERKNDRDHDHDNGNPRGLLCPGDSGCNVLLVRWVTAPVARAIATSKAAAGERDAARWDLLASYLERVEAFYR